MKGPAATQAGHIDSTRAGRFFIGFFGDIERAEL
jgi:hypothetical protein